jgi:hypothetical protein
MRAEMQVHFHVKSPLLLSDFNDNWEVLIHFRQIPKNQIS